MSEPHSSQFQSAKDILEQVQLEVGYGGSERDGFVYILKEAVPERLFKEQETFMMEKERGFV